MLTQRSWRSESPEGRPTAQAGSHRAVQVAQAVLAIGVMVALLVVLMGDAVRAYTSHWNHPPPYRARGRLVNVLAEQERNRMVSVSIGLAARHVAGGVPRRLTLPNEISLLSDLPPDYFGTRRIPPMQRYLVKLMVGGRTGRYSYDPRVPTEVFDSLVGASADSNGGSAPNEVKEFPFGVYAVRRMGDDAASVIAVADVATNRIAVISRSLSPITACTVPPDQYVLGHSWMPKPEWPAECPVEEP